MTLGARVAVATPAPDALLVATGAVLAAGAAAGVPVHPTVRAARPVAARLAATLATAAKRTSSSIGNRYDGPMKRYRHAVPAAKRLSG